MYAIYKTENGNMRPLHTNIQSHECAYEMLRQIKASLKNSVLGRWQLKAHKGKIIYQIKEENNARNFG